MRWLRAIVLVTALSWASGLVVDLLLDPLLESWQVVSAPAGTSTTSASGGLATVVVGCCAALLLASWLWLLAAVGACTWEALRAGPDPSSGATTSLLRPRVVRAVVATCLGATALASPSAQALPVTRPGASGPRPEHLHRLRGDRSTRPRGTAGARPRHGRDRRTPAGRSR